MALQTAQWAVCRGDDLQDSVPTMNSNRPVNKAVSGGMQCRSVWFCAFFAILLAGLHFSAPLPAVDGKAQGPATAIDQADRPALNRFGAPVVRLARAAAVPMPMGAFMAQGIFALPADTETSDSESAMAKLANPLFPILLYLVRVPWRPTAPRHLSTPLYLSHQCLLC